MSLSFRPVTGEFQDALYNALAAMEAPTLEKRLHMHTGASTPTMGIGFDLTEGPVGLQKEVYRGLGLDVDNAWIASNPVAGSPYAIEKEYIRRLVALTLEPLAKLFARVNLVAGLGKMEGRGRPFLA